MSVTNPTTNWEVNSEEEPWLIHLHLFRQNTWIPFKIFGVSKELIVLLSKDAFICLSTVKDIYMFQIISISYKWGSFELIKEKQNKKY